MRAKNGMMKRRIDDNCALRGSAKHGFTLVEVMVALAILGGTLFILLEAHSATLMLCSELRDEQTEQHLLAQAITQTELDVVAGSLSGQAEFSKRHPDWSYSFNAQTVGEDDRAQVYLVTLTLTGPEKTRDATFMVCNTGQTWHPAASR